MQRIPKVNHFKMRHLPIIALCAITMSLTASACGTKTQSSGNVNNADSVVVSASDSALSKEVAKRVTAIYDYICKTYNSPDWRELLDKAPIEGLFCSDAWKKVSAEVDSFDAKHPDDEGWLDYDIWVQGQDWDTVSYSDVRILNASPQHAEASLIIHNGGDSHIRLILVKEKGTWKIDDLFDKANPQGIRKFFSDRVKSGGMK